MGENGTINEILVENKENLNRSQQIQLEEIRSEQIRQSDLLNELMGKVNELTSILNNCSNADSVEKVDIVPSLEESQQLPSSCLEAALFIHRSGIYEILVPSYSQQPFNVSCDEETQGGGWTTVLRREDGSVDFFLYWEDYKNGFGNLTGEFFIGLEKLHKMTKAVDQELLIVMEDFKGRKRFARYEQFVIGSEEEAFKLLTLGHFSGDAGDEMRDHAGQKFSTRDRDNDASENHCAEKYMGAWWYKACHFTHLTGQYNDNTFGRGIIWLYFTSAYESLKRVQMLIRPRRYCSGDYRSERTL
ncbi:GH23081 [Drosophila grimshawi]|uniref:GH23081 n=1 Tax=Drosophila grimshawi TaxID=7222 RepID=B4JWN8_DROGR|nr:GH23081 [Drosophila grimshawi]